MQFHLLSKVQFFLHENAKIRTHSKFRFSPPTGTVIELMLKCYIVTRALP